MTMTPSQARYLIAMYEASDQSGAVACSKVAQMLGVTRPAVAKMAKTLIGRGVLRRESHGHTFLTDDGYAQARQLMDKVEVLCERIPSLGLDLSDEQVYRIACAMVIELECA